MDCFFFKCLTVASTLFRITHISLPPPSPPLMRLFSPNRARAPSRLQVVDSGSKNMEIVVIRDGVAMLPVDEATLEELTAEVVAEAEALKADAGAGEMKD